MVNKTEAARQAQQRMNELFDALQAVQKRMEPTRLAGVPIAYELYAEWEQAYKRFQNAHEEWKQLTLNTYEASHERRECSPSQA